MLGTTQLIFADHITFNNGYMKHAHTMQRMTNNNNNNKKKPSLIPPTIPVCFPTHNRYIEVQT